MTMKLHFSFGRLLKEQDPQDHFTPPKSARSCCVFFVFFIFFSTCLSMLFDVFRDKLHAVKWAHQPLQQLCFHILPL